MATDDRKGGATGAGAEAAAGLHGAQGNASDPSAAHQDENGGQRAGGAAAKGGERSGSEPLTRDREHKGSYGGEGGAPRTSSDSREEANPSPS